jgi:EF-P beta-lysylation protein EpmB
MIHISSIPVENKAHYGSWQSQLSQCKIKTRELLAKLGLEGHPLVDQNLVYKNAETLFELRVPPRYLDKINPNDPNDPLLLQILPQHREFDQIEGFSDSPLNEEEYSPVKGLLHKYKNRVLLMSSTVCAINCRYCFRRNFPYDEHRQSKEAWQSVFDYIWRNKDLDEVILSGGEPLIHSNEYLAWMFNELAAIPHLKRIRIHSRMILSIPERVDDGLIQIIKKCSKQIILVTHCNHPNELGPELIPSITLLKQHGVTLLNQSVLLKGINDQCETLSQLSLDLFEFGILPYYLFMYDRVSGAAHFEVDENHCYALYSDLLGTLPGYLVPRLSQELPGENSKSLATFKWPN